MKILVVSQNFWPENFRINNVVYELSKKNLKIDVLTGIPNYPQGKIFKGYKFNFQIQKFKKKITLYRVPIIPRGSGSSFLGIIMNYFSFLILGIFYSIFNSKLKNYDLIFVYAPSPIIQSYIGILLAYLNKIPVITWVQDLWPENVKVTGYITNRYLLNIIKFFVRDIYKRNNLLLISSKSFQSEIKKIYNFTPIKYFPNPPENLLINKNRKYSFIKKNKFNVIFAGNLGIAQGLETVLDAALLLKKYKKINIVLLGHGNVYHLLKKQIKEKNLNNIQLPGNYDVSHMGTIYAQASALLITLKKSKTMSKTVPAKLQSYLSAGKMIIGSIEGEAAKIIKVSGSGLVCKPEDPISLSKILLRASKMKSKNLKVYEEKAITYFNNHYNPDMLIEKLKKIFINQISKNKK